MRYMISFSFADVNGKYLPPSYFLQTVFLLIILSSILLSRCQPTWTNTLPRHFCRGPASHKPFDFLPSSYTFYMFYTAKTFSVHFRVRNHYTKRILNLILNRKKFFGRENDPLDKQKPRKNRREPSPPCKRRFITLSRSHASLFKLQSGRSASG